MMQALCDRNFKGDAGTECAKGTDGRAPGEDCTCGFYSAASSDTFMDMPYAYYGSTNVYGGDKMNGKVARIYGRVALAGKVIPGSQGWRSQYAWPVELYVPYEHTALVDILHDTYHVPVKLQNWQNPLHPNDGEE